jgi:hypothetical protein
MPSDLAKVWASRMLRSPGARRDIEQLFDEAAAIGAQATLIAAPELMTNGKGCMVRWTGNDLVVVELSAAQQRSLGVVPAGLWKTYEPRPMKTSFSSVQLVTVGDVRIDNAERHDGFQPLTGTCTCSFDGAQTEALRSFALEAQYVRPDFARPIATLQFFDAPLIPPHGELRFSYPPMFSPKNPVVVHGAVVLFLQLVTANDWRTQLGCQCISNSVAATINLL